METNTRFQSRRALKGGGGVYSTFGLSREEVEFKQSLFKRLVRMLDLSLIGGLSDQEARDEIAQVCESLMAGESLPFNLTVRQRIVRELQDEILGLGPLEGLLADPTVSDILVNGYKTVYVERRGKLEPTNVHFDSDRHLMTVIDRIVSGVGRRIDESSPMVDARLKDGSRVNAVIAPLALDGPLLSIRRFSVERLGADALVELGTITPALADLLRAVVKARLNLMVSGGTGSGKTTMLNVLSGFIPENERIVTIEDSAELQLQQPHVARMETRPPNVEGKGGVDQRDLVRNSLRMRPDRIVLGEVRGAEALDMLQAMNTGHDGSLTTIHANTPPGRPHAGGDHGRHERGEPREQTPAHADCLRDQRGDSAGAAGGREAAPGEPAGDQRSRGRGHHHVRDLPLRAQGPRQGGQCAGTARPDRYRTQVPGPAAAARYRLEHGGVSADRRPEVIS